MPPLSTILVAGDQRLYRELSEALAGKKCRVINAPRVPDALQRASEASAIIVDATMGGGVGEDLCRRLRADPVTAHTLLFVRGTSHQRVPNVDEVLSTDLQHTLAVLETYLPEISEDGAAADSAETLRDEEIFDITASAEHWQRHGPTQAWPPPPPQRRDGLSLLDFAREYAGYAASLEEGYHATDLSASQRQGLQAMTQRVVAEMDSVLGGLQDGINDALRRGDLQRMRELSAAKNVAFARLQKLRGRPAAAAVATDTEGGTPLEARDTVLETTSRLSESGKEPVLTADTGRAGLNVNTTNKSRLTLAAEAKEAERARRAVQAARQLATARTEGRKRSPLASPLLWVLIIGVAAAGAWVWRAGFGGGASTARPAQNRAPQMRQVTLQEQRTGIVARFEASDPDGDSLSYTVLWFVAGRSLPAVVGTRLASSLYEVGQEVTVRVTPIDRWGPGPPMVSQPLVAVGAGAAGPRRQP